jgi:hypothetical protein
MRIATRAASSARGFGWGSGGAILVPSGLIVPLYNTSTVPSGWSRFTSADNKAIVGAGSTYAGGDTSTGTTSVGVSGSTVAAGSHNDSYGTVAGGSPGSEFFAQNFAGSHAHTYSGTISAIYKYKTFVLIKASAATPLLPANAVLLGTSSLSTLTNVETATDALLYSTATYGSTGGGTSGSQPLTVGSAGNHAHNSTVSNSDESGDAGPYMNQTAGSHDHTASASWSIDVQRAYLTAWTNASANFSLVTNGIAMYESATPPAGWVLCDGTNGTVDLRNYFLHLGNTGNQGTRTGSNAYSWTGTGMSGNAPHEHTGGAFGSGGSGPSSHLSIPWNHAHSYGPGSGSALQPYYSLYFIQKTA